MTKVTTILLLLLFCFPVYINAKQTSNNDTNESTKADPNIGAIVLKTNLIYDIILTPNIEVEVPISKKWSVAGEWIFPWWIVDDGSATSSRCRLQLLNLNVEGKYWLGNRKRHDLLTGWYCGLYSGAGLYDLEYKASGYQGEFFIAAGVSSGYAHTINKSGSLRMEYSLGLGYMKTKYRHYESMWGADNVWHPVRESDGTYTWMGPTRVRVSLAWMVGKKKRGGSYE